jgi:hypothetical protein
MYLSYHPTKQSFMIKYKILSFCINIYELCLNILAPKEFSIENFKYEVIYLDDHYNTDIGCFSIQGC